MSRRTLRSVLAVLAVAGGLAFGTVKAEAAERGALEEAGAWSRALRWVAHVWEENVLRVWEASQVTPVPPEEATSDEGWMLDPNG